MPNGGEIELTGDRYDISQAGTVLIIKDVIKDDKGDYICEAFSEQKADRKTAALDVLGMYTSKSFVLVVMSDVNKQ